MTIDDIIASVLRDVAELPDRSSPDGKPDMMLVTGAELREILIEHLASWDEWRAAEYRGEV